MCFPTIQQSLYLKLIQQHSEGKTEDCQALTAGFNTDILEQKYCGHTTTIWHYSRAFHREFIRTSSRPQSCKPQSCWMLVLFTAFTSWRGTTLPEAHWRGERSVLGIPVTADHWHKQMGRTDVSSTDENILPHGCGRTVCKEWQQEDFCYYNSVWVMRKLHSAPGIWLSPHPC